jgi:hypothetical protein
MRKSYIFEKLNKEVRRKVGTRAKRSLLRARASGCTAVWVDGERYSLRAEIGCYSAAEAIETSRRGF